MDFPRPVSFSKSTNEYPENQRFDEPIRKYKASSEVKYTIHDVQAIHEDECCVNESFVTMTKPWMIMHRNPSSFVALQPVEFNKIVNDEINMAAFEQPYGSAPQHTASFSLSSSLQQQHRDSMSRSQSEQIRGSIDFSSTPIVSVEGNTPITATSGNANRQSLKPAQQVGRNSADVNSYKKIIADSRGSIGDRTGRGSISGKVRTTSIFGRIKDSFVGQKLASSQLTVPESTLQKKLGVDAAQAVEAVAHEQSNRLSDSSEHRLSVSDHFQNKGFKDQELDRIRPVKQFNPTAEIEIANEEQFSRLMSIYDLRFSCKRCSHPNVQARENAMNIEPYPEIKHRSFALSCSDAKFSQGTMEPFFIRASLYDMKNQRKISEDFIFQLNKDKDLAMLDDKFQVSLKNGTKHSIYEEPTALFKVQEAHLDIFLVIIVDRILQSNGDAAMKAYKDGTKTDAIRKHGSEFIKVMGSVRSPFLWGAIRIFRKADNIDIELLEGLIIKELYPIGKSTTSNPFDPIRSLMIPEITEHFKKQKVECSFKFSLNEITSDRLSDMKLKWRERLLANQLPAVEPKSRGTKFFKEELAETIFRVIQDFPLYIPTTPNLCFNNSLYIYPESVNLSSEKSVQLRISFHLVDKVGVPGESCFAGLFNPSAKNDACATSVFHHTKNPQWFDEFRIDLPFRLPPSAHILIETLFVSTGDKKKKPEDLYRRVGYSFVQLFDNHTFLLDKVHELPIYKKLVDNYLSKDAKELDLVKGNVVKIRTRHASSIYSQDPNAALFFGISSKGYQIMKFFNDKSVDITEKQSTEFLQEVELFGEQVRGVESIKDANTLEILQFAPVILNTVLRLSSNFHQFTPSQLEKQFPSPSDQMKQFMSKSEMLVKRVCASYFKAMLYFLSNVVTVTGEKDRKNALMNLYTQLFFDNMDFLDKPFYHFLLDFWMLYLEDTIHVPISKYNPKFAMDPNEDLKRKSWSKFEQNQQLTTSQSQALNYSDESELCQVDSIRFSWFFCDLILKSIALYAEESDANSNFNAKYIKNDVELHKKMLRFIKNICPVLIKTADNWLQNALGKDAAILANTEFSMLMCDLLSYVDLNTMAEWIREYTNQMEAATYQTKLLDLQFVEIFTYHDAFLPLVRAHHDKFGFLIERFTSTILDCIVLQFENIKTAAYAAWRNYLIKLDYDSRLNTKTRQEYINLHLSMLIKIIDGSAALLQAATKTETQDLPFIKERLVDFIVCFLYLLVNLDPKQVEEYFANESHISIKSLCDLLLVLLVVVRQFSDTMLRKAFIYHFRHVFKKYIVDKYLKVHAMKFLKNEVKPGEQPEEYFHVVEIFDRSTNLLLNMLLSISYIDTKTVVECFENMLNPFLSQFGRLFTLRDAEKENKALSHLLFEYTSTWSSLFGGILLHCALPTSHKTHPSVAQCFTIAASIYNKLPDTIDLDHKPPVTIEEEDEDNTPKSGQEDAQFTSDDEMERDPSDNSVIMGGTHRKLVEHLFDEDSSKPPYYQSFFITYRSFTTPLAVLIEIRRYLASYMKKMYEYTDSLDEEERKKRKSEGDMKMVRFLQVFKFWIANHYSDLDYTFVASFMVFLDSDFVPALSYFVTEAKAEAMLHSSLVRTTARKLLDMQANQITAETVFPKPITPPNFSKSILQCLVPPPNEFNFLEWDVTEIARQITLIDFEIFKPLQFTELFVSNKKKDHAVLAPHVHAMTDRFNKMSLWAVTVILNQPDESKRQLAIRRLLDLCDEFRKMRNYNTLYTIVGGALGNNAIYRLKTWDAIPDVKQRRDEYNELMRHPYNNIRKELEQAQPPCVPFLGMFLTEIEFNDQNAKFRENKKGNKRLQLINFKRCLLNSKSIQRLREKQQKFYEYERIEYLNQVFTKIVFETLLTHETAYKRSLEITPSARSANN